MNKWSLSVFYCHMMFAGWYYDKSSILLLCWGILSAAGCSIRSYASYSVKPLNVCSVGFHASTFNALWCLRRSQPECFCAAFLSLWGLEKWIWFQLIPDIYTCATTDAVKSESCMCWATVGNVSQPAEMQHRGLKDAHAAGRRLNGTNSCFLLMLIRKVYGCELVQTLFSCSQVCSDFHHFDSVHHRTLTHETINFNLRWTVSEWSFSFFSFRVFKHLNKL